MGLFSIFTGFIYNDCFSKSFVFPFTKSLYQFVQKPGITEDFVETKGFKKQGTAFFYGMDPVSIIKEKYKNIHIIVLIFI